MNLNKSSFSEAKTQKDVKNSNKVLGLLVNQYWRTYCHTMTFSTGWLFRVVLFLGLKVVIWELSPQNDHKIRDYKPVPFCVHNCKMSTYTTVIVIYCQLQIINEPLCIESVSHCFMIQYKTSPHTVVKSQWTTYVTITEHT